MNDQPIIETIRQRALTRTARFRVRVAHSISPELNMAAAELRLHLDNINTTLFAQRYTNAGPCPGCFDAVEEYDSLVDDPCTDPSDSDRLTPVIRPCATEPDTARATAHANDSDAHAPATAATTRNP